MKLLTLLVTLFGAVLAGAQTNPPAGSVNSYNQSGGITAWHVMIIENATFPIMQEMRGIFPDGRKVERSQGDMGAIDTSVPSKISMELGPAFDALSKGNREDATKRFGEIESKVPHWPYVHFWLALSTGEASEMQLAAALFAKWRQFRMIEPEALLYEGLALAFLGNHDGARQLFKELKESKVRPTHAVGYITFPSNAPDDLKQEYDRVVNDVKKYVINE